MTCINPIRIYKNLDPQKYPEGLQLGCGKCIACRIKIKVEWSLRMLHELKYHENSVFLTLTYNDEHLPNDYSLKKDDLVRFIKRLRKRLENENRKIKYFACGEYGDKTYRPHYHIIVFGLGLTQHDKDIVKSCWKNCDWSVDEINKEAFGLVEYNSIMYVAKYIQKKYSGELEYIQYTSLGLETPFRLLSNGLGKQFALDNKEQIQKNGYITMFGVKHSIPRYYIKILKLDMTYLSENAIKNDSETVKYYTNLYMTQDEFYRSQNASSVRSLEDAIMRAKTQQSLNLNSRIQLKESKI